MENVYPSRELSQSSAIKESSADKLDFKAADKDSCFDDKSEKQKQVMFFMITEMKWIQQYTLHNEISFRNR